MPKKTIKSTFDANLTIWEPKKVLYNFCYNLGAFYKIIKIILCLNVVYFVFNSYLYCSKGICYCSIFADSPLKISGIIFFYCLLPGKLVVCDSLQDGNYIPLYSSMVLSDNPFFFLSFPVWINYCHVCLKCLINGDHL